MYVDHEENRFWNLWFNVKFGALEKEIWVLEKSWKSSWNVILKKGTNPVCGGVPILG